MSLYEDLGLKSYSFHKIADNRDVAVAVKTCGVDTIDISGSHVDYGGSLISPARPDAS